jgi:hypothetical protein
MWRTQLFFFLFLFCFPHFSGESFEIFPKSKQTLWKGRSSFRNRAKLRTTKFDCAKGGGGGDGRENWWADRRMTTAREGCRDPPPFETTAQRRDRVAGRGRERHGHGPRLPSPVPPHALRPNNQSPFHSAVQPFILPLTAPVLLLPTLRLCTFQCRHLSSQAQPVSLSPWWVGGTQFI